MRECHCHILLSSLERDFSLQISAVSRPRRGFQPSAGQSVSQAVPPRSPHHRLKGRLRSPRSTQVQSTRVVRVWVWSLKVARKSRSGIGNGIGNILESLSTLSRLVSRSRERTFLCTSDPIHMRCGRLLHTADVCSRTQTTTDKPPRLSIVSRRSKFHGRLLAQRCLLLPSIHGQRSSPLAAACQLPALGRRSSAPRAGAAQQ
jgi:hypothetical protein